CPCGVAVGRGEARGRTGVAVGMLRTPLACPRPDERGRDVVRTYARAGPARERAGRAHCATSTTHPIALWHRTNHGATRQGGGWCRSVCERSFAPGPADW